MSHPIQRKKEEMILTSNREEEKKYNSLFRINRQTINCVFVEATSIKTKNRIGIYLLLCEILGERLNFTKRD